MKIILKYIKSWGIHYRWTIGLCWLLLLSAFYKAVWDCDHFYIFSMLTVLIMDLVYGFDRTSPLFCAYHHDAWENKCAWFAHKYSQKEELEFFQNTGKFIDNRPIQRKLGYISYTCTKCGDHFFGDTYTIYS